MPPSQSINSWAPDPEGIFDNLRKQVLMDLYLEDSQHQHWQTPQPFPPTDASSCQTFCMTPASYCRDTDWNSGTLPYPPLLHVYVVGVVSSVSWQGVKMQTPM